ncbi:hypothetical protein GCM10022403_066550 [Streptomyces coacervatus]|uniref:Uncharacterized protein n=1 Tax=Streptomyces coacervatus TaxID=647381 RepID=A0ABP7IPX7_9ACTN
MGAAVDGVMACCLEPLDEVVLEFEARMVGAEIHAHGSECDMAVSGRQLRVPGREIATAANEPQGNLK